MSEAMTTAEAEAILDEFDRVCEEMDTWRAAPESADAYVEHLLAAADSCEVGDVGRAEYLSEAGWTLCPTDPERALTLFAESLADEGLTVTDPRVGMVRAWIGLGRVAQWQEQLRVLRAETGKLPRSTSSMWPTLGSILYDAGELARAERHLTIGLRQLDPEDELDAPTEDQWQCAILRFRIRRTRGRGLDAYDRLLQELDPEAAAEITALASSEASASA